MPRYNFSAYVSVIADNQKQAEEIVQAVDLNRTSLDSGVSLSLEESEPETQED